MSELRTDLYELEIEEKGVGNALYATTVILCCSCSCCYPNGGR